MEINAINLTDRTIRPGTVIYGGDVCSSRGVIAITELSADGSRGRMENVPESLALRRLLGMDERPRTD